jgi:hypothetical protein
MSETPAACVLCAKPLTDADAVLVNGKRTCAACRDAVLAELAKENEAGARLAPAVLAGLAAAAACGAAWAGLIVLTGSEVGFAAVGVGWTVAHAVRLASGDKRGPRLQKAAVACSALGLLLGKYFFVASIVRKMAAAAPDAPPGFMIGWFDPRMLRFFVSAMPRLVNVYDALWIFLAFSAAWRVLKPAKVALADARGISAPAA